jgi:hypothetical protein
MPTISSSTVAIAPLAQAGRQGVPEAQVLLPEHRPKAGGVVTGEHLIRDRTAHVAVAGRAGLEHLQRLGQVQAGLAGQHHRLDAGGQHRQREQVVHELEGDPVARRPDVEDVAASRVEDRLDRREVLWLGPDHEDQRARVGLTRAPAHRRVRHSDATLAQPPVDRQRHGRVDRAAIHDDRTRLRPRRDPIPPERHGLDVWPVRQHRDDDV